MNKNQKMQAIELARQGVHIKDIWRTLGVERISVEEFFLKPIQEKSKKIKKNYDNVGTREKIPREHIPDIAFLSAIGCNKSAIARAYGCTPWAICKIVKSYNEGSSRPLVVQDKSLLQRRWRIKKNNKLNVQVIHKSLCM